MISLSILRMNSLNSFLQQLLILLFYLQVLEHDVVVQVSDGVCVQFCFEVDLFVKLLVFELELQELVL